MTLRRQSLKVLAELARRAGEPVGKEELRAAVWGDTAVTDDSLVQCVTDIRKVLGDTGHGIVQTLPRVGYRLVPGRPASTRRRMVLAAVAVAAAGLVTLAFALLPTAPDRTHVRPRLAVLAFDDLSAGADRGYLSDAIAEGTIAALARFTEIEVVARNSSFSYRGNTADVRRIAAELGADYVLEGSQQKAGDALRVTVQLIDGQGGGHIWANSYQAAIGDLFAVQDEIVHAVAASVGARLVTRAPPASDAERVNALHLHLRGRAAFRKFSEEGSAESLSLNLQAVAADPDAPFGYAGLAFVYAQVYRRGWLDMEKDAALAAAIQNAEKAVAADPEYYSAQFARGWVAYVAGDTEAALAYYDKALTLNPSATRIMNTRAIALMSLNRMEESAALLREARRLDPHHPDHFRWNLSWVEYILGDCQGALRTYRGMKNPPGISRRTLAAILVCLGRTEDARATIAGFLSDQPDYRIADVRSYMEREFTETASLEKWLTDLGIAGLPD